MITVSTTSSREARDVAAVLRQASGLDYRVFLMGRQVAARIGGVIVSRLPDFASHHPGNCPPDCREH